MAFLEFLILLPALDWRNGSVDKVLACIHEDQSSNPQGPHTSWEEWGRHSYHIIQEVETKGS